VTAADTARAERDTWVEIHDLTARVVPAVTAPGPNEVEVTGVEVARDLVRRQRRWGIALDDDGLPELARFAAALAATEAEAWERDDAIVATQAFEDRRFLFTDRVVHWTVPWADVAGRCHSEIRSETDRLRDVLLDLGERLRPAPLLTGSEGLHPPGEDSFGPTTAAMNMTSALMSLHCGTVIFEATVRSLTGATHGRSFTAAELADRRLRGDLASLFENASARWTRLADEHPGTERLWRDLASRAEITASQFEG
jgi:hypothetical protein